MIQHLTKKRDQGGFTLIELLVVIVILGILAAVVVFAVGGITDKGQDSACKSDTKTLRTAEEAYFAQPADQGGGDGKYGTMDELSPKFLAEDSTLHTISLGTGAESYEIKVADEDCGTVGATVGGANL